MCLHQWKGSLHLRWKLRKASTRVMRILPNHHKFAFFDSPKKWVPFNDPCSISLHGLWFIRSMVSLTWEVFFWYSSIYRWHRSMGTSEDSRIKKSLFMSHLLCCIQLIQCFFTVFSRVSSCFFEGKCHGHAAMPLIGASKLPRKNCACLMFVGNLYRFLELNSIFFPIQYIPEI